MSERLSDEVPGIDDEVIALLDAKEMAIALNVAEHSVVEHGDRAPRICVALVKLNRELRAAREAVEAAKAWRAANLANYSSSDECRIALGAANGHLVSAIDALAGAK